MSGTGRLCRIVLPLLAAGSLSACVAAVIPLAAGGAMLRSDAVSGDKGAESERPVAAPHPKGSGLVVLDTTVLPAPSEADIAAAGKRRLEARSFDAFYGYALTQAETDPLEAPMRSAMLVDPAALEPLRQDCGLRPPAVLIDLDPAGSLYDPQTGWRGQQPLSEVVAVLRSRKIAIAWITGQPAGLEAPVRGRLGASGLDPAGKDRLLMVDDFLKSKQKLRASFGQDFCIIAIAGDSREDFDELYSYLKNPEAALPLDELIGAGWFLTPTPID